MAVRTGTSTFAITASLCLPAAAESRFELYSEWAKGCRSRRDVSARWTFQQSIGTLTLRGLSPHEAVQVSSELDHREWAAAARGLESFAGRNRVRVGLAGRRPR